MHASSVINKSGPCPWDLTDVAKVFIFYLLMMGLGSAMTLAVVHKLLGDDPSAVFGENTVVLALSMLTNGLTCFLIIYIVTTRLGQPLAALGISLTNWRKSLARGLLRYVVVLPVIIAAGFLVEFMTRNVGVTPEHQEVVLRFMEESSYSGTIAIIIFGVLVGPVAEEILFRGFLQPVLKDIMGGTKAILLTSLLFALVHFNLYILLQIFILGVLLGYLYEDTGTLVAPVTVHVLHNSVSLCVLLFIKQSGGFL